MAKNTTTVTIDEALLEQARKLDINISAAAEKGVQAEVKSIEDERIRRDFHEAGKEIRQRLQETGLFSDGMRLL